MGENFLLSLSLLQWNILAIVSKIPFQINVSSNRKIKTKTFPSSNGYDLLRRRMFMCERSLTVYDLISFSYIWAFSEKAAQVTKHQGKNHEHKLLHMIYILLRGININEKRLVLTTFIIDILIHYEFS